IRREFLERAQTRAFLIGCLLGPVLIAGVIFLPAYLALRNVRAATGSSLIIIDATGAGLGERLRASLAPASASPGPASTIDVRVTAANAIAEGESLATKAVVDKSVDGYVVLDAKSLRGQRARYAGRKATAVGDMRRLELALRQSVLAQRLATANLSPELVD